MKHLNLKSFLSSYLSPLRSACITTVTGECLHLEYESPVDIVSLPLAAKTAEEYLNLSSTDRIALLNDPYSGGSILSTLTFVSALPTGKQKSNLLIAIRVPLKPKIQFVEGLDQEGVRIPPTPIYENEKVQDDILDAISSHPLCPSELVRICEKSIQDVLKLKNQFLRAKEIWGFNLDKEKIQNYLQASEEQCKSLIGNLPSGDKKITTSFATGEKLSSTLEIKDHSINANFQGSSNGKKIFITQEAALGALIAASIQTLQVPIPINSGVLHCFSIRPGKDSFLNAQYPNPVYLGNTEGLYLLTEELQFQLSKLCPKYAKAESCASAVNLEIEFGDKAFYDRIAGGFGASREKFGEDAIEAWWLSRLQASIEKMEKLYPLRILNSSWRQASSGGGQWEGGNGMQRRYELMAPAKFRWISLMNSHKARGIQGGYDAVTAQVQVYKKGKEKLILDLIGELELQAGDQIHVLAGGGGGFGRQDRE